ncbi:wall-associated receptor kinase 3-like [Carex rostrata]
MNMMKKTKRNSLQVVHTLYSTLVTMILTQLLLHIKSTESGSIIARPGCEESCGGIPIPYPFGIGLNCSLNDAFNVTCHTTYNNGTPTPYLSSSPTDNNGAPTPYLVFFPILNISLSLGQARIGSLVASQCYNTTAKKEDYNNLGYYFGESVWLNTEKNKFTVIGCNTLAYLGLDSSTNSSVGCLSSCDSLEILTKYGSCSGIGCCQTAIPTETSYIDVWFDERSNNSEVHNFSRCSYATVVEEAAFIFQTTYITNEELSALVLPKTNGVRQLVRYQSQSLPVLVNWVIEGTTCDIAQTKTSSFACRSNHSICLTLTDHGYLCNCSDGYEGNPYLHGVCQDINECANPNACSKPGKCHNFEGGYRCSCPFGWRSNHNNPGPGECDLNVALVTGTAAGIAALIFLGVAIYVLRERRNLSKVKEIYFQQHGGWILLEKIKLNQGFGFTIFTKQQVEQATDNFASANILGYGGHGTVYKGTLRDQTVAIKKCKIVDESKKKEFGKEMLILSQINHKNIVKILGCCLEVEVPMLVYEFIPNGTLSHYIHGKKQGSRISLPTRLRIAHESAEALAYLHSSASPPIFHGDVKSANILLDQNYMAKVSDFGASILVPTDEAQCVTLVQGTFGYLDPEYVQSCKLTDKSDVYSFGVVLLELLTSKPVVNFDAPEDEMSLSSRFLSAMEENKIQELLDDEIKNEDDMELIMEVAELAKKCLSMKGEERPTMEDVAEELLRVNKFMQHPWRQEHDPEETETLLTERSQHSIEIELMSNYFNTDNEAEQSIAIGH